MTLGPKGAGRLDVARARERSQAFMQAIPAALNA